jgi:hypothetical protein
MRTESSLEKIEFESVMATEEEINQIFPDKVIEGRKFSIEVISPP